MTEPGMAWLPRHRRSLLFCLLLLIAGGIASYFALPVSLFPDVAFPRIAVSLDAGDRPAELMLQQVTQPVEEALRQLPGIRQIRSTTSRGSAEIAIDFAWGRDMSVALLQVDTALDRMLPGLPPGTRIDSHRMDPTRFPVLAFSLRSATLDASSLRDLALYQLRPLLVGITGVARVGVQGGATAEYQVNLDPARLQALGLRPGQIVQQLRAQNVYQAVGRFEDHYKLYLTVIDQRAHSLDTLRRLIVATIAGQPVHLADVASVAIGPAPQWQRVSADGQEAVLLQVYQQPNANSVRMVHDVDAALAAYRRQLPAGVILGRWYDQSELVLGAANSVRDAMLLGTLLAALVLLLFLRHLKVTLIAVLVVPATLATTLLLMHALGMSLNIMTLGGMAAAVGLIIDDAIVMVEHILRRLRDGQAPASQRVLTAARELLSPLLGSSAATLVIFLPLAFLSGVTGAFFKALATTMSMALVVSFFLSWLVIPLLAERFLKASDEAPPATWLLRLQAGYARLLAFLLHRPLYLLVLLLPLCLGGWTAYRQIGSGFMPVMDEGGFTLDYRSPPGTSLSETDRLVRQMEAIIRANPNVASYSRRTGAQLGGWLTEANEGDLFIRLKDGQRAPVDAVMDDLRTQIATHVPGLDVEMAQLMEDLIGDLTAVPQPVEVRIFASDPQILERQARRVAHALGAIRGLVDLRDGITPAGDSMRLVIDPAQASFYGLSAQDISDQVSLALQGVSAGHIPDRYRPWNIRVWQRQTPSLNEDTLAALLLRNAQGQLIPLRLVAHLQATTGEPQIDRDNLARMLAVTARISGRDLGSSVADVRKTLRTLPWPRACYYRLGGLYAEQQQAFNGLLFVLLAAIALVFLLLLFLYESLRSALALLSLPLFSLAAVFIGLRLGGAELDIASMMGMTMVVGIVTEVGIFYFSELAQWPLDLPLSERLVLAGRHRLLPITMTTLAAILTLLPLALAWGQGAAMQQALAIAIISGLCIQLPLVLLVMPVLYARLQAFGR